MFSVVVEMKWTVQVLVVIACVAIVAAQWGSCPSSKKRNGGEEQVEVSDDDYIEVPSFGKRMIMISYCCGMMYHLGGSIFNHSVCVMKRVFVSHLISLINSFPPFDPSISLTSFTYA